MAAAAEDPNTFIYSGKDNEITAPEYINIAPEWLKAGPNEDDIKSATDAGYTKINKTFNINGQSFTYEYYIKDNLVQYPDQEDTPNIDEKDYLKLKKLNIRTMAHEMHDFYISLAKRFNIIGKQSFYESIFKNKKMLCNQCYRSGSCKYSSIYKNIFELNPDWLDGLYGDINLSSISAEHVVLSQLFGRHSSNCERKISYEPASDLHILFAVNHNINETRGVKPFKSETDEVYQKQKTNIQTDRNGNIRWQFYPDYNSKMNDQKISDSGPTLGLMSGFIPRQSDRFSIAAAYLYVDLIYIPFVNRARPFDKIYQGNSQVDVKYDSSLTVANLTKPPEKKDEYVAVSKGKNIPNYLYKVAHLPDVEVTKMETDSPKESYQSLNEGRPVGKRGKFESESSNGKEKGAAISPMTHDADGSPVPPGTNLYKRLVNPDQDYWLPYFYTPAWVRHYSMHSEMFIDWITTNNITKRIVINSLLRGLLQRNFNPFVVHLKKLTVEEAAPPRYCFTSVLVSSDIVCNTIEEFINAVNTTPHGEKKRYIADVLNTTAGRASTLNDEILAFPPEEFVNIFNFISMDPNMHLPNGAIITREQLNDFATKVWREQNPGGAQGRRQVDLRQQGLRPRDQSQEVPRQGDSQQQGPSPRYQSQEGRRQGDLRQGDRWQGDSWQQGTPRAGLYDRQQPGRWDQVSPSRDSRRSRSRSPPRNRRNRSRSPPGDSRDTRGRGDSPPPDRSNWKRYGGGGSLTKRPKNIHKQTHKRSKANKNTIKKQTK